jgi:hypothetical protein
MASALTQRPCRWHSPLMRSLEQLLKRDATESQESGSTATGGTEPWLLALDDQDGNPTTVTPL